MGDVCKVEGVHSGVGSIEDAKGVVDVNDAFLRPDSGTMFMHEDASAGVKGEVGVIEGVDSGSNSGSTSVHEGTYGGEVNAFDRRVSDLVSETMSVVHEDACEVVGKTKSAE
jgi:hypothetical protein